MAFKPFNGRDVDPEPFEMVNPFLIKPDGVVKPRQHRPPAARCWA